MINLRKRGGKLYLWGEHLGVKVQRTTKTDCPVTAEKIRQEEVHRIEQANPTLAEAYHIQQEILTLYVMQLVIIHMDHLLMLVKF